MSSTTVVCLTGWVSQRTHQYANCGVVILRASAGDSHFPSPEAIFLMLRVMIRGESAEKHFSWEYATANHAGRWVCGFTGSSLCVYCLDEAAILVHCYVLGIDGILLSPSNMQRAVLRWPRFWACQSITYECSGHTTVWRPGLRFYTMDGAGCRMHPSVFSSLKQPNGPCRACAALQSQVFAPEKVAHSAGLSVDLNTRPNGQFCGRSVEPDVCMS